MGFPQENMDSQSSSLTSAGLCAQSLSCVQLFVTPPRPWTADHQAPLSLGFPRQGYWNGFPFPPPGNLPNPGIKPFVSCFGRWIIYLLSHLGSPRGSCWLVIILHQGLVNLFLKGQVVNILGTSGHMMSVTVIQLWLWWESSHRQYVNEWM